MLSYEIWAGRFLWAAGARVPLPSNNPHSVEGGQCVGGGHMNLEARDLM